MPEQTEYNFKEATVEMLEELVKVKPNFSFLTYEAFSLPEDAVSGDMIMFSPLKKMLIKIDDEWYTLPDIEMKEVEHVTEEDKANAYRNDVINGMFEFNAWKCIPTRFIEPLAKGIDMLEADREILYSISHNPGVMDIREVDEPRNEVINGLLSITQWPLLPKKYHKAIDDGIALLRKDHEDMLRKVQLHMEIAKEMAEKNDDDQEE